jgi:hypothetical protein
MVESSLLEGLVDSGYNPLAHAIFILLPDRNISVRLCDSCDRRASKKFVRFIQQIVACSLHAMILRNQIRQLGTPQVGSSLLRISMYRFLGVTAQVAL